MTLLQVSSSGKTLLINKGSFDEIDEDDYGVLLVKEEVFDEVEKYFYNVFKPVAKLKLVKLQSKNSVWIVYKSFIPDLLTKDANLLLLSETSLLSGREKLVISRKKIISSEDQVNEDVKETLINDGSLLSKREDKYNEVATLHEKEEHFSSDVELIDVDIWEEKTLEGELSQNAIFRSPYAKDFSRRKRIQTFEKMVVSFIRKYSDPRFNMEKFYKDQERDYQGDDLLPRKGLQEFYLDTYQRRLSDKKHNQKVMRENLESKGEAWSDDYSDEELKELMYNIGAISERERRRTIIARSFNYQIYGSFGVNLVNNENLKDRENTAQSKYDFEVAGEYYLFKNIEKLRQFSLETSFRRANDAFTTGSFNAVSLEYSAALHLNWYPFQPANALETNIIYFSILSRYGVSSLEIPSQGEQGNYQIMTFPGIRLGVKYNFNNSFGARLALGLERIHADREVRNFDAAQLPDRISYTEGKLSFGISKFF